jgi:Glyoxalase-like domain
LAAVRLRQAVLVAHELEPAVARARSELGLGEPFRDPQVAFFGLQNAVFAIGDCFLEIVAPTREGTAAGRYLERTGGEGGYMVMFDLPELPPARARAAELGIRTVWEIDLPDISGTHLHPRDIGGAIVSIDSSRPQGSWRWAGPAWTGACATPAPGALTGVTLAVEDPEAVAERWARVLGAALSHTGAGPAIELEGASVLFERAGDGAPESLVEIALTLPPGAGAEPLELLGVRLRTDPRTGL